MTWLFNLFGDEAGKFRRLGIGLILWLVLALIIQVLYPDTSEARYNTAAAYAGFVWKNSSLFIAGLLIVFLIRAAIRARGGSIIRQVRLSFSQDGATYQTYAWRTVLGIVAFMVFMWSFAVIKTRIPVFVPFHGDVMFAQWDRSLFLGRDPWAVFGWIYDLPTVVRGIDMIYDMWAGFLVGAWLAAFVFGAKLARNGLQYCLAVLMTWFIGGVVLATGLSSAGPCYFLEVTGQSDFVGQMDQLRAIGGLRAVDYQQILWAQYQSGVLGLGGISAMPSMHCATAFLMILAFGHHSTFWRWVTIVYFLIILLGSFLLAWHYLVDGLLAIPIAWLGWILAGRLLRGAEP